MRAIFIALALAALVACGGQQPTEQPPSLVKLYVLDGGTLHVTDPSRFQLKKDEVAELNLSVGCYLVTHPRGVLLWDTCAIPDSEWTYTGSPVKHHLVLPDKQERDFTLVKPLTMQLADAGQSRATITHLALSHYHYDHTANANLFPKAAWLVTDVEREAMFAVPPRGSTRPSTYEGLRSGGIIQITGDDHDVFGDGTVVIKAARGHTEGHQVLYVKLAKTGGVVLAGDLYHYPEERTLDRVPIFEVDAQQTRAARKSLDRFLNETKAQLWIQHDFNAHAKLKKAPEYYD